MLALSLPVPKVTSVIRSDKPLPPSNFGGEILETTKEPVFILYFRIYAVFSYNCMQKFRHPLIKEKSQM